MSSGWAEAETTGSHGEPVRKAQLHSMLLKQSPLSLLSCSHLFISLSYSFGKSRECHPSQGVHPTPHTSPVLTRWLPSGVTLAFTILQSANDICILLAGESVGWGVRSCGEFVAQREKQVCWAGGPHWSMRAREGTERWDQREQMTGETERLLSKDVPRTQNNSQSSAPPPPQALATAFPMSPP